MAIHWLDNVSTDSVDAVGIEGASLAELWESDLSVPRSFVVTTDEFQSFLSQTGIENKIREAVDVNVHKSAALADAAQRAQLHIYEAEMPKRQYETILDAYRKFGDNVPATIQTSVPDNTLPDTSLVGNQGPLYSMTGETLIDRIKECWASLFTQREIYYRHEEEFDLIPTDIAVVVQQMIKAEISGVLRMNQSASDEPTVTIKAARGVDGSITSKAVAMDKYVINRNTGGIVEKNISDQEEMYVHDGESNEIIKTTVPSEKQGAETLSENDRQKLLTLNDKVSSHHTTPQDVKWAIAGDVLYLLQSTPIAT